MGIPKFFGRWLKKVAGSYPGVIQKSVPAIVNSLFIDTNSIIHSCAQMTYGYGEYDNEQRRKLISDITDESLEKELFRLIENKLLQIVNQVKPRVNIVIAIDGVTPLSKMIQQRSRRLKAQKPEKFNPNSITAGTDFMRRLDKFLTNWISKYAFLLPPNVYYSSHLVPGEGETKIMDLIRQNKIKNEGSHVLYGLDADLILLSLISPLRNIFLMREDVTEVINIENLKAMIIKLLGSIRVNPLLDFVLITSLVGNDFIPPLSTFYFIDDIAFAMESIITVYKKTNKSLTDKQANIDFNALKDFFKELAVQIRDNEMPLLTDIETEEKSIQNKCINYIEGMQWILYYYTKGTEYIDKYWYFSFEYGPFADDLYRCHTNSKLNICEKVRCKVKEDFFNTSEYMLIVLPDKELLPAKKPNLKRYFKSFNKLLPNNAEHPVPTRDITEELKKLIAMIKDEDKIKHENLIVIRRNPEKQAELSNIREIQDILGVKICLSKPHDFPVRYHK